MNIKKIIKISFSSIIILICVITFINQSVTKKIEENTQSKNYISQLISIQEVMSRLVLDAVLVTSLEQLEDIEQLFISEEKKFERLKSDYLQKKDTFYLEFNKDINALYTNEKVIEKKFEKIYDLEKQKLKLNKKFSSTYPLERTLRQSLQNDLWESQDLHVIKNFADLKYYSKEALYQHKNVEYLNKWLNKALVLKSQTNHVLMEQYINVIKDLTKNIFELNTIESNEKLLIQEIQDVLDFNYRLNELIEKEIEYKLEQFINTSNMFLFIISTFTICLVMVLAYKVYKNVGLSVDEIEEKVEDGLQEIKQLNHEIEITQKEVVFTMGAIGESRSKETGNHVKRVAEYSKLLALYYGLPEKEAEMLKQASPMHDIGKVGIPDSILNKPGRFDEQEREIMNTHAKLGYDMLKNSNRPLLKMAATVAYEHHEKWDGTGYPQGKAGEDIHIYGRITALADVFDALGSDRVYKKAWSDESIFSLFKDERGKHFDPQLVDIFFENLEEFLKIRDTFKD